MSTDRELLELAAKAARFDVVYGRDDSDSQVLKADALYLRNDEGVRRPWNPLTDDGDRLRLARALGISIDFADCCAWKRLPNGDLIQEYWGGDCGDEAHAVLRAAAEIGRSMLGAGGEGGASDA